MFNPLEDLFKRPEDRSLIPMIPCKDSEFEADANCYVCLDPLYEKDNFCHEGTIEKETKKIHAIHEECYVKMSENLQKLCGVCRQAVALPEKLKEQADILKRKIQTFNFYSRIACTTTALVSCGSLLFTFSKTSPEKFEESSAVPLAGLSALMYSVFEGCAFSLKALYEAINPENAKKPYDYSILMNAALLVVPIPIMCAVAQSTNTGTAAMILGTAMAAATAFSFGAEYALSQLAKRLKLQ